MPNKPLTMLRPCFIAFPKTMPTEVHLYSTPFVSKVVPAHGTRTLDGFIYSDTRT
uniref:Uncharacterized protein n=1 Tax=Arundo donax TaxID=35708 RepID=A0A0A9F2F7_ARUDO